MFAASLWAIDALIRVPLTQTLSPMSIVFWEHVVGLFILLPFCIQSFRVLPILRRKDWVLITLLTLISSIGGTLLFTYALQASFSVGDFITPLLLQKLQPLFVILLSSLFLQERVTRKFFIYTALALIGSYLMSFGFTLPAYDLSGKTLIVLFALGASLLWGCGTILSKTLLKRYTAKDLTFIRFGLAIPIAFLVSLVIQLPISSMTQPTELLRFILIALSTGAAGLFVYYKGLKYTPAHIATIAELVFPFISIVIGMTALNPYGAPQTLTTVQWLGILLLIIGIMKGINQKKDYLLNIKISGKVIHGSGDGKKLGFPTANVKLKKPLNIDNGVYAAWVWIHGERYKGVLHYGPRLVYGETHEQLEVHIYNFSKNIYDKTIKIHMIKFLRGTMNFSTVNGLIVQMEKDKEEADVLLSKYQK
jgi:drug/metabolite transporter (DMT)-like permease